MAVSNSYSLKSALKRKFTDDDLCEGFNSLSVKTELQQVQERLDYINQHPELLGNDAVWNELWELNDQKTKLEKEYTSLTWNQFAWTSSKRAKEYLLPIKTSKPEPAWEAPDAQPASQPPK